MSFFFRFCFRCDAQDRFAVFCVRRNGGVCLGINDIFHQCFHGAFPYTCHTQDFRNESIFLFFLQIRFYLIFKHGHGFLGRPGQHSNDLAVFLHDDTRGSAVVIVEHNAVFLRHHSLFSVVFCHGSACAFEIFFDSAKCSFIKHQFFPEIFRRCFFCQVVFCGAKSARGDDQVSTGKCLKNGIF
ncbi:unknown [Clostridium sp. CAG:505]|nr:unknown [Clostridium sp. CAG:505]